MRVFVSSVADSINLYHKIIYHLFLLIAAFAKPPKPEEEPQISDESKQTDTTVEIASTERIDKEEL